MVKIDIISCKACNTGLLIKYLLNGTEKENYYNNILELKEQYKLNYNPFSKGIYTLCNNRIREDYTTPLQKSIAELTSLQSDYKVNKELEYFYKNYNWSNAKQDYKSVSSNLLKLKLACKG